MKKNLLTFSLMISVTVSLIAQNLPFPQNKNFFSGTIKPNHKTDIQLNSDVTAFYALWKAAYLKNNCTNSNQYFIDYNDGNANVSEGTGYGMIITAMMAGSDANAKTIFDGLYLFYKAHPAKINKDLMAWKQISCVDETPGATNSATDGDVDIAFGLVAAHAQWGSAGTINYLQEAKNIINAIMLDEINPSNFSVELGDWVNSGSGKFYNATRSSDFVLSHFKSFETTTGDSKWTSVYEKCQSIISTIQTNNSPNTGLLPDFIVSVNTTPVPSPAGFLEGNNDGNYHYNACRDPWRIGSDYLFNGDIRSKTAVNKINNWLKTKYPKPSDIQTSFNLAGTVTGGNYREMAFLAPFMVGMMVDPAHQTYLNSIYDYVVAQNIESSGYYGNTIKMICLLIASGNYIPAVSPIVVAPVCPTPSLGVNQSLCGLANGITLTTGLGTNVNRTVTWYKNNTVTGTNSNTLNVTLSGTYIAKIDSGTCSKTDTIVISASIPTPDLGASITLCSQPTATLDAGVTGTGLVYTWLKDNVTIPLEISKTLTVTTPGTYKITLSATGCTSVSSQVLVSSSLLDITNDTICKAGDQATLKINSNNIGPFYWFDALTNGTQLYQGKTYVAKFNSNSTVYTQEGAGVSGTIGGTGLIAGNAPWSPNPSSYYTSLKFTTYKANITIASVDIYLPVNAKANNLVISVLNSGGTVLGSSSPVVVTNTTGSYQKVTVPINATTTTAAAGYQIAFTSETKDNNNAVYQGTSTVYPITENTNTISLTGGNLTFNNIVFSSGSNCARTPVNVTIDPNNCKVTALDNTVNNTTFSIAPNPAQSNATLEITCKDKVTQVEIFDLIGNLIWNKNAVENNSILIPASIKSGMYIIKIAAGTKSYSEKLLIK